MSTSRDTVIGLRSRATAAEFFNRLLRTLHTRHPICLPKLGFFVRTGRKRPAVATWGPYGAAQIRFRTDACGQKAFSLRRAEIGWGMSIGHGYDDPSVAQLAVFLYNRVGQLRDVLRILDQAHVQVYGLTVSESSDCAIVRLIPSEPATACFVLRDKGYAIAESEVLAVAMPSASHSLLQICQLLLRSEVNILQAYPIMLPHRGTNAIVLSVDSRPAAVDTLRAAHFDLLDGEALKKA